MPDYRKLEVYKLASSFSDRVAVVVARLPRHLHDKADQLRRAADSIHENIAEGCGLRSDPQLLKYLKMSLGSANESEDELHTLKRRGFLEASDLDLIDIARRLCAMLAKFIHRVEADIARDGPTPKRRPGRLPGQRASERPKADAES